MKTNLMEPVRILVVEDERIVAEDLAQVLSALNYSVVGMVDSGADAIQKTRELSPDLIMMDINLAGAMSGIEAADAISLFHDAPVIYLTAFADTHLIEKAKITRPYGYILKPYQEREIKAAIEIALYTHRLHVQLRESEERYRGFVENFLGIAYRRKMDLSPEFFHGAVEMISGYTEKDLQKGSPSWEELIFPEDAEHIRAQNREIVGLEAFRGTRDYRIIARDGSLRWVHELIQVIPESRGTVRHIQGAMYDITERKVAEESLKHLNQELEKRVRQRTLSLNQQIIFLQQLIDTIPSPVYYKDVHCSYLGCNTAFESYLGMSRSWILGKTDDEILPPEIAGLAGEKDRFLLNHRGIQAYQAKFPHADHSTREVLVKKATYHDSEGNIAGFIGVLVDITDRIRVEEALRESEQRFRTVVQDQTDLIWRFRPDRTVLFANNAFLSYFRKIPEDLTGYIFRLPVHPDDQPLFDTHISSLTPSHPVDTIEVRCRRDGTAARWQQWITRAFFDEQGHVHEYLSVGRDITEKKDLECRQREAYQQIEKNMQQFATLNDQIRNPLTVIVMLAGQETGEHAENILARAREIDAILDELHTGWQQSEKIRQFLKKHYGIGGERDSGA